MGKLAVDLTNQKFGRLTVLNRGGSLKNGGAKWLCVCECGKETIVEAGNLRNGATKSCGCLANEPRAIDISGQKYGRLTVLRQIQSKSKGAARWLCKCECGNEIVTLGAGLRDGHTASCGCISRKHGMFGTPTYTSWTAMKSRCCNVKEKSYKHYGGRGITVCDRWLNSFENFLADMGERPSIKYSLDRIDNNGNYEPSNCKWSTAKEQANNTRRSKKYKVNT